MSRKINRKCQQCAFLDIGESREKTCWAEGSCNSKRNYYRTREKKLSSKTKSYAIASGKIPPTKYEIVPDTYRAELILYGKSPNKQGLVNGGVKAIKVNVYQGSHLRFESNLTATAGMTSADLEDLIDKTLGELDRQFGIKLFGEVIWKNK